MKHYIGIKHVQARPMTHSEFLRMRGLTPSEDEDKPGYLVQYAGDGYQSWCPKEPFEQANIECPEHRCTAAIMGARIEVRCAADPFIDSP